MNIENVTKLRDFLLTIPDDGFDHLDWESRADDSCQIDINGTGICGTTACIGGWATIIAHPELWTVAEDGSILFIDDLDFGGLARRWLGLDGIESEVLFMPFDLWDNPEDETYGITYFEYLTVKPFLKPATRKQAIAFLSLMITQNRVDIRWWRDIRQSEMLMD